MAENAQELKQKQQEKYNNYVKKKIAFVSKELHIPIEKYEPEDIKGNKHLLGVFESETKGDSKYTYQELQIITYKKEKR